VPVPGSEAIVDDAPKPKPKRRHKAAAWGVHLYTALGLPLAFVASIALAGEDAAVFFACMWVACIIDSTDGFFARRLRVREILPSFDGRKLDDLVDYLWFVFLPVLGLPAFGVLEDGLEWFAVLPLMASAYGFCQERAKTQESFVGFPSYWNILLLYFYVLQPSPWLAAGILSLLSLLVFVPIHYLYPSKTRLLRPLTVVLGAAWALALAPVCLWPDAAWAPTVMKWSVIFPVYYFALSLVHHYKHAASETPVAT
jgi:phosphatidylcholine synthase